MGIETGTLQTVDSMRHAGRRAARGLALAALVIFTLTMAGCGGAGGATAGSGGNSCTGAVGPGLFFAASDGASGVELWKTNGTDAGTVCVKDINGAGSSSPFGLTVFNGALYFLANDGVSGVELWKSDGTIAGTVLVKDINPGPVGSSPFGFTVFKGINDGANGALYFAADDGTSGVELWKTDGTSVGTVRVKDINPAINPVGNSSPFGFTVFKGINDGANGALYFAANDGSTGFELWKTNGTDAGTVLVKDINTGAVGSSPSGFTVFNGISDGANGALYFSASDGALGSRFELWKTDGTGLGTVLVKNWPVTSFPSGFTVFSGALYFQADDGVSGLELWKSNGTLGGTVLVKDINPGAAPSFPNGFTVFNGALYFAANDGTSGVELWKTDGTLAGTVLVKDISPTDSNPSGLTVFNGALYFAADDGTSGVELWKTDTVTGPVLVKDINAGGANSNPSGFTAFNGALYFQADDGTAGIELWKTDGTEFGTVQVKDINPAGNSSPTQLTPF